MSDKTVRQVLLEGAQAALDAWLRQNEPDVGPTMVTRSVLIVEALDEDGEPVVLNLSTKMTLHDLLGMIEQTRIAVRERIKGERYEP